MLVADKKKVLLSFCNNTECYKCPLSCRGWAHELPRTKCLIIAKSPETDLDKALEIIEKYKEDDAVTIPPNDVVTRPKHYTDGKIEVIEFIEDKNLGFCLGNAIKYIARAGKKDPSKEVEDLKKARWYIERRIKELEEGIV